MLVFTIACAMALAGDIFYDVFKRFLRRSVSSSFLKLAHAHCLIGPELMVVFNLLDQSSVILRWPDM